MKLIHKQRQHQVYEKAPRIAISEAEITADLLYPASRRPATMDRATRGPGSRR